MKNRCSDALRSTLENQSRPHAEIAADRGRTGDVECAAWQATGGFKFVRQHPIGPYFADFACREKMVVVEIDGGTHGSSGEIEADVARTRYLEAQGYRVLRARNAEIDENIHGVLELIYRALNPN